MQLFCCTTFQGHTALLNEEESLHCVKVLRKKAGDTIYLIDGKGGFYTATLVKAHPRQCELTVIAAQQEYNKRNYRLHIAIAPTKNMDRIEWFAEKAVELGIDEISFLFCHTSERRVLKTERVKKIVEAAVKQSLQAYLPQVNEPQSFREFISRADAPLTTKLIAHCAGSERRGIAELFKRNAKTLCLIGPEGDFSEEEIELALNRGFSPVSLGNARLRTETAGLYVCNAFSLLNS